VKLPNFLALAALVGCVILLALLLHSRNELALANAALASIKSANADLSVRLTELEGKAVEDGVLKRLQADQREAIKLRGEVGALKKSLATAESKAVAAAQKSASTTKTAEAAPEPTNNPYTRVFGRKVNANVSLGHGLLFGGWPTEPGKQAFAMAVPHHDPANGEVVELQTKLFEITDEALAKLDTTTLVRAAGQQTTMTPEQMQLFITALESTAGISILASPNVTVASGRPARVSVGQDWPTPDGKMVHVGPVIDFVPTLAADGVTVDLTVDAKLTLPNKEAPVPPQ
jgi:Flp pilus assembly secretin CpaC